MKPVPDEWVYRARTIPGTSQPGRQVVALVVLGPDDETPELLPDERELTITVNEPLFGEDQT